MRDIFSLPQSSDCLGRLIPSWRGSPLIKTASLSARAEETRLTVSREGAANDAAAVATAPSHAKPTAAAAALEVVTVHEQAKQQQQQSLGGGEGLDAAAAACCEAKNSSVVMETAL